ncbi:hypothetical protein EON66_11585, partial [archaeon]
MQLAHPRTGKKTAFQVGMAANLVVRATLPWFVLWAVAIRFTSCARARLLRMPGHSSACDVPAPRHLHHMQILGVGLPLTWNFVAKDKYIAWKAARERKANAWDAESEQLAIQVCAPRANWCRTHACVHLRARPAAPRPALPRAQLACRFWSMSVVRRVA